MAESLAGKGAETELVKDSAKKSAEAGPGGFKAIVLGATGATGCYVVGELLTSKDFKEVTLLGRRKVTELPENFKINIDKEESSGHLKQIVVDLEQANEENSLKYFEGNDAYFTCFGTTRANAGSNANFRHIDHGYNVKFGEMAKKAGIGFCSLLSSSGANSSSFFTYLKVKGEIESVFKKLQFPNLTILRPGVLDRKQKNRFGEKVVGIFMTKMPVDTLAKAIVADSLSHLKKEKSGEHQSQTLFNQHIFDLAKTYKVDQEPKSETAGPSEKAEGNVKTSQEVNSGDGVTEEQKDEEGKVTDAVNEEGNGDQINAEKPSTPENAENKTVEDQPSESEKKIEEPANDAGNEIDENAKENDKAE